ncbi:hypothetical protein RchiOBHm_Chr1g0349541 [Rosa chinensis]|uniref:Uncharacterized protein n=1 Tax=Rosa chinensis TaxID=74649 RepID=A0A2P6SFU3_ROSCH|nr:hypothetical protein RchiOBHm_Chr1g0349541 [Rosa chinensis]
MSLFSPKTINSAFHRRLPISVPTEPRHLLSPPHCCRLGSTMTWSPTHRSSSPMKTSMKVPKLPYKVLDLQDHFSFGCTDNE